MQTVTDINLLDLDRWARDGAPHEWFAQLRDESPVWYHPSPDSQSGFWVISRHEDVVSLGRIPQVLSSDAHNGGITGLCKGDELYDMNPNRHVPVPDDAKMLLHMDPPQHTQLRKIVNKAFTPKMIAQLEDQTRNLFTDLLDECPKGDVFDFVPDVSMKLPVRVIGDMIGAPPKDYDQLLRWTNEAVLATDPEYRMGPQSNVASSQALLAYFNSLREARQGDDRDDLISVLINAEVDGERLSQIRFGVFLLLLAAAGTETTRNAMSHAIIAFHENPDQWQRLRDDPDLIPTAVEEILRWSSPVLYFRRNAMIEMDLHGHTIAAGDSVTLWYVSANRDATRFTNPDSFDISRQPNDHIAFGGGGPHFCLGASLARLELRIVLEELVDRYAGIEVAGPFERLRSNFLHGIKHLPVRLQP